ncbi:hypothetical protein VUR80DRAFT_3818 [Thermomyces stellatus]
MNPACTVRFRQSVMTAGAGDFEMISLRRHPQTLDNLKMTASSTDGRRQGTRKWGPKLYIKRQARRRYCGRTIRASQENCRPEYRQTVITPPDLAETRLSSWNTDTVPKTPLQRAPAMPPPQPRSPASTHRTLKTSSPTRSILAPDRIQTRASLPRSTSI